MSIRDRSEGKGLGRGELPAFDVGGTSVAVASVAGHLYAFLNICTHRGCRVAKGRLEERQSSVHATARGSRLPVDGGAGPGGGAVGSCVVRVEGEEIQVVV